MATAKPISKPNSITSVSNAVNKVNRKAYEINKKTTTSIANISKKVVDLAKKLEATKKTNKAINQLSTSVLSNVVNITKNVAVGTGKIVSSSLHGAASIAKEYRESIAQDFSINKEHLVGMALANSSPIFGFFASKLMNTTVMKNITEKFKDGLSKIISNVGSIFVNKFKKLKLGISNLFSKTGSFFKGLFSKNKEKSEAKTSSISPVASAKTNLIELSNKIPKLQEGGLIKKGGIVEVHPAEVVTPAKEVTKVNDTQKILDFLQKTIKHQSKVSDSMLSIQNQNSKTMSALTSMENNIFMLQTRLVGSWSKFELWQKKFLINHPIFRKILKFSKFMWKIVSLPTSIILKKFGTYKSDISKYLKSKSPFEALIGITAQSYCSYLERFDDMRYYLALIASAITGESVGPVHRTGWSIFGTLISKPLKKLFTSFLPKNLSSSIAESRRITKLQGKKTKLETLKNTVTSFRYFTSSKFREKIKEENKAREQFTPTFNVKYNSKQPIPVRVVNFEDDKKKLFEKTKEKSEKRQEKLLSSISKSSKKSEKFSKKISDRLKSKRIIKWLIVAFEMFKNLAVKGVSAGVSALSSITQSAIGTALGSIVFPESHSGRVFGKIFRKIFRTKAGREAAEDIGKDVGETIEKNSKFSRFFGNLFSKIKIGKNLGEAAENVGKSSKFAEVGSKLLTSLKNVFKVAPEVLTRKIPFISKLGWVGRKISWLAPAILGYEGVKNARNVFNVPKNKNVKLSQRITSGLGSIIGLGTEKRDTFWKKLKAGGLGALQGGLTGLELAGPYGAIAGALLGGGAAAIGGRKIAHGLQNVWEWFESSKHVKPAVEKTAEAAGSLAGKTTNFLLSQTEAGRSLLKTKQELENKAKLAHNMYSDATKLSEKATKISKEGYEKTKSYLRSQNVKDIVEKSKEESKRIYSKVNEIAKSKDTKNLLTKIKNILSDILVKMGSHLSNIGKSVKENTEISKKIAERKNKDIITNMSKIENKIRNEKQNVISIIPKIKERTKENQIKSKVLKESNIIKNKVVSIEEFKKSLMKEKILDKDKENKLAKDSSNAIEDLKKAIVSTNNKIENRIANTNQVLVNKTNNISTNSTNNINNSDNSDKSFDLSNLDILTGDLR